VRQQSGDNLLKLKRAEDKKVVQHASFPAQSFSLCAPIIQRRSRRFDPYACIALCAASAIGSVKYSGP
jgi:hypothetical protein